MSVLLCLSTGGAKYSEFYPHTSTSDSGLDIRGVGSGGRRDESPVRDSNLELLVRNTATSSAVITPGINSIGGPRESTLGFLSRNPTIGHGTAMVEEDSNQSIVGFVPERATAVSVAEDDDGIRNPLGSSASIHTNRRHVKQEGLV